jgi:hypothetical protein
MQHLFAAAVPLFPVHKNCMYVNAPPGIRSIIGTATGECMSAMILEGIVTTISPEGELNIAPMGPIVEPAMTRLVLRPFRTSHTYRNLKALGEGVFHVTDNVLMLAQGAIGKVEPMPEVSRATSILGYVIEDACRFYEFRVTKIDDETERVTMEADVTHTGWRRDFFGFNRAKHAVLEAAILATRTAFLPPEDVAREFARLAPLVSKTGGPVEHEAFALLQAHVDRAREQTGAPSHDSPRGPSS